MYWHTPAQMQCDLLYRSQRSEMGNSYAVCYGNVSTTYVFIVFALVVSEYRFLYAVYTYYVI